MLPGQENCIALEVCDLAIGYGERTVLENLNFTVKRGEIFAIMGSSGCGKSTLLKHIIGIYPPQRGSIRIFGRETGINNTINPAEIAQLFGVTYQGGALLGSLTLAENVALVLEESLFRVTRRSSSSASAPRCWALATACSIAET